MASNLDPPEIAHVSDESTLSLPERRDHNNKQLVSRLPNELLAHLFLVTTELSIRPRGAYRFTLFPDVAVQVCSRWMKVALASPSLWTHLHIREHFDKDNVAVWVSRAGRDTLLDIEIDILEPYCGVAFFDITNWTEQEYHIEEIFKFFCSIKAGPHRWRSLSLSVLQPEPLYEFIRLLNKRPAPKLRYLYLSSEPDWNDDEFDEERPLTEAHYRKTYSLSEHAVPNLRHAEFTYVSWAYVFDQPKPLLSGLTTLQLSAGSWFPPQLLFKIQKLLSTNPNLEMLQISTGPACDYEFDSLPDDQRPRSVHLASLRTLSLDGGDGNVAFVWGVLWIIDAPLLESLYLTSSGIDDDKFAFKIADYIMTGQSPDSKDSNAAPTSTSLFPLLREFYFGISLNNQRIADLLSTLPQITHLSISCYQAGPILGIFPHILPHLEVLSLVGCLSDHRHYQGVEGLLTQRALAGTPIRVVEVSSNPDPEADFEERFPGTVLKIRKD